MQIKACCVHGGHSQWVSQKLFYLHFTLHLIWLVGWRKQFLPFPFHDMFVNLRVICQKGGNKPLITRYWVMWPGAHLFPLKGRYSSNSSAGLFHTWKILFKECLSTNIVEDNIISLSNHVIYCNVTLLIDRLNDQSGQLMWNALLAWFPMKTKKKAFRLVYEILMTKANEIMTALLRHLKCKVLELWWLWIAGGAFQSAVEITGLFMSDRLATDELMGMGLTWSVAHPRIEFQYIK